MWAWLLGTSFPVSVISDHKNLEYFMSSQVLNCHQTCWAMFLSDFNFHLDQAPGCSNVTDAPSWHLDYMPKKGDATFDNQSHIILTLKHTECLFTLTNTVPALTTLTINNSHLLDHFKTTFWENSEWCEALVHSNTDFMVESELVFHKGKLFVPAPLQPEILHSCHDSIMSGHSGCTQTFTLVAQDYTWPGMYTYVQHYVEAYNTCPRTKDPHHKPYRLLKPLEIPKCPWKGISMDFTVKLPISHNYNSIWVICDHLTHAAHFIPCHESMSAPKLAYLFLNHIFHYHGLPDSIVSDCGSVSFLTSGKHWPLSLKSLLTLSQLTIHNLTD
jgi:hypothetical protein